MKLGVSMWSYHRDAYAGNLDPAGFVRVAKQIGADGVELLDAFYKDPAADHQAVKDALLETGLPCPIFSVGPNFAKDSESDRAAEVAKVRFGIEEAVRLGSNVVRVFAGDVRDGIDFDSARRWLVECLAECSRIAAGEGRMLALENHGRLAGRSDQVRGLIDDVRTMAGNDALGANPDTGNFLLVDETPHHAVRNLADLAKMVHFKDFAAPGSPEEAERAMRSDGGTPYLGAAIGEGVVDLAACVTALKEGGFDGWLSIEYEGQEPSETAVPRSVVNARSFLR